MKDLNVNYPMKQIVDLIEDAYHIEFSERKRKTWYDFIEKEGTADICLNRVLTHIENGNHNVPTLTEIVYGSVFEQTH